MCCYRAVRDGKNECLVCRAADKGAEMLLKELQPAPAKWPYPNRQTLGSIATCIVITWTGEDSPSLQPSEH